MQRGQNHNLTDDNLKDKYRLLDISAVFLAFQVIYQQCYQYVLVLLDKK